MAKLSDLNPGAGLAGSVSEMMAALSRASNPIWSADLANRATASMRAWNSQSPLIGLKTMHETLAAAMSFPMGITETLGRNRKAFTPFPDSATSVLKYSSMAVKTLEAIGKNPFGSAFALERAAQKHLYRGFNNLTSAYTSLFDERKGNFIPNSALLDFAPSAYLQTAKLIASISELDEEVQVESPPHATDHNVEHYLGQLDPAYLNIWIGALQAMNSQNVEKIRHFCASTRELLRFILDHFSPDNQFIQWNSNTSFIYNNQPTRAGRLHFIFRNKYTGAMTDFIDKDINMFLDVNNTLHKQTHAKEPNLNETQHQRMEIKNRSYSNQYY